MIHYIEENRIVSEVIQCNKLALAIFTISNNELCQKQIQILHDVEESFKDNIEIFQIDLEESQETKIRYQLASFPTLLFFKDGKEIERIDGLVEKQNIINIIQDLKD